LTKLGGLIPESTQDTTAVAFPTKPWWGKWKSDHHQKSISSSDWQAQS